MTEFVAKTQDEIIEHLKKLSDESKDPFGFAVEVALPFLDYDHAKPWLKPECTPEDWAKHGLKPNNYDNVVAEMADYMPFVMEKIRDERGLSMMRSAMKMSMWLWLIGDNELSEGLFVGSYGADAMTVIAEKYNLPLTYPAKTDEAPVG